MELAMQLQILIEKTDKLALEKEFGRKRSGSGKFKRAGNCTIPLITN